MASIIRMPEVLAGATEGVLSNWLVSEGSDIAVGDVLAEIETEKATVEYQAEEAGVVAKMLINPGDAADVGTPIAIFTLAGEGEAEIAQALADAGVTDNSKPAVAQAAPEVASATATPSVPVAEPARAEQQEPDSSGGRLFVSPLVRKMAKEKGIDLSGVSGSGPGGRIVRADFDALVASGGHVSSAKATSAPPAMPRAGTPSAVAGYVDIPHTGMRKAIARRLTESKSSVPHFYLSADCRVDKLLAARKEANEARGVKISVNDWVVKAAALALIDVPDANVIWSDDAMRKFDSADIAIAVATEGGLLTPVIRGVDTLSLIEINALIADAAARARSGKIKQEEIEGGSFAVTNLGMYGTKEFSAIINPPQSGILAVGAASAQAVVENGQVVVAQVMTVTLSADHRAVDGALAAQWLQAFQNHIENPLGMLI